MTTAIIQALSKIAPNQGGKEASHQRDAHFVSQGSFPVHALAVDVQGFGPLPAFLQGDEVARLSAQASAAAFGLREKTLLDTTVRDTAEIKASALKLSGWEALWPTIESTLQTEMGLGGVALQAHLHNALLYGPGQFFKMHQDTEKLPDMVLTLVLVWPCAHLGGHLVVHQREKAQRFASEHLHTDRIQWFAFYADCQHEVKPVKEGHRVVLTFNVVLRQEATRVSAQHSPALLSALKRYFAADAGEMSTDRLVIYLDHQYSEKGLSWSLLKGADRARAEALRSAAETMDLSVYLALAEIHESWTATPGGEGGRRARYQSSEPEPDELIDDSTVLNHWVGSDDAHKRLGELLVQDHQIDWTRETEDEDLVNSEYEGYMGNYGETLDYWYRRAAVVLWPKASELMQQFELDFEKALRTLVKLSRQPRQAAQVQSTVKAVKSRLVRLTGEDVERFTNQCELAACLSDESLALDLMAEVSPWAMTTDHGKGLLMLLQAHGESFCTALISRWRSAHPLERVANSLLHEWHYSADSVQTKGRQLGFSELVKTLQSSGFPLEGLAELAQDRLRLWQQLETMWPKRSPQTRQRAWVWRCQWMADLIRCGLTLPNTLMASEVVQRLEQGRVTPEPALLSPLLLELGHEPQAVPGWSALRAQVLAALDAQLAQDLPAADDWAMQVPDMPCQCADCQQVMAFLRQKDTAQVTLAMAEHRRDHLSTEFGQAGLALSFEVVRQGSPYKLVIKKPSQLRALAEQRRTQWQHWREALG